MKENGELKHTGRPQKNSFKTEGIQDDAYDRLATRFKVSTGMISMARELLREAPDTFTRVKDGHETVAAAHASMLVLRFLAEDAADKGEDRKRKLPNIGSYRGEGMIAWRQS